MKLNTISNTIVILMKTIICLFISLILFSSCVSISGGEKGPSEEETLFNNRSTVTFTETPANNQRDNMVRGFLSVSGVRLNLYGV